MLNQTPLLKSDKLTDLLTKLAELKVRSKQSQAETQRLTKIIHPQYMDATTRFIPDIVVHKKTLTTAVVTVGIDEQAEAASKAEELKRTLAGEPLADSTGVKEKLEKAHRQWAAIEDAIEF